MMRFGGNKTLRELFDVYNIDRFKTDKTILYNSRLMDFYRKFLKSKVNKETIERDPPPKDEALKSINVDLSSNYSNATKYASISKSGIKPAEDKYKSVSNTDEPDVNDTGFVSSLNSWMSSTIDATKFIAFKVGEIGIHNRIIEGGNAVGETGSSIVNKGTEAAKSEKVQSFAKKANDGINFVINKIFGGSGKKEENANNENTNSSTHVVNNSGNNNTSETAKIDINNEVKFEKNKK